VSSVERQGSRGDGNEGRRRCRIRGRLFLGKLFLGKGEIIGAWGEAGVWIARREWLASERLIAPVNDWITNFLVVEIEKL
jgi:hypothetical protein